MDQLEEIKSKIDIVELINSYVPLKKAGRNFKALCPFHSEKTPSFIVSPERQIWHCFGACNEGGDIFKFLMKIENLSFGEAVQELAKRAGVKLTSYRTSGEERQKQLLYEINHLAAEFYHYLLLNHPLGKKALNYILGRGINKEALQLFKLGFAPNSWKSLQDFLIHKKGYKIEDLERAGLVIASSKFKVQSSKFYDRFRGRLIFPLKNHRNNICGFAGRKIPSELRSGESEEEAKYVNTPETLIYHKSDLLFGLSEAKEEIKKEDEVILVEGELDVISSYQAGIKNVVAIKGSALTENQVRLIARFTKNIIFALDKDIAGDQAARRGIEVADMAGMMIKVIKLKGGKDPDEIAQKKPQLWSQLVKEAMPVYDYLIDSAFSRFNGETIEGKRKIGEELIPTLAKITNEIVKAHYVKELAGRLGIDEEAVVAQINKMEEKMGKSIFQKEEKGEQIFAHELPGKSRREVLEEYLLSLGFQSGDWSLLRKRKVGSLVKTHRLVRILEVLKEYLKRYKTINSERLAKMLEPELLATFNKFYLFDLGNLVDDEEKFKRELEKTITRLEKIDLSENLRQISDKIKELEKQKKLSLKEQKKLEKLNQEFRDLSSKLINFEEEK